jgi:hypothetical protein
VAATEAVDVVVPVEVSVVETAIVEAVVNSPVVAKSEHCTGIQDHVSFEQFRSGISHSCQLSPTLVNNSNLR